MKNCGKRFHQEIGKFRFLNEIIKVISPKYLGTKTTEKVKKKCIELMYSWHKGLPHEPKITDAYVMLKQQGIIKEDPTYMDKVSQEIPKPLPEEERRAPFEDDEKAKTLARLLKSKNPEDLQAANRLIKNMVKQDTERMEKISRRINELETIHTNAKLLNEMVNQYNPETTTASEKEMMKELYESLEKLRSKLFRLASETEEADTDGLNTILKANDEVSLTMSQYKKVVEGITENGSTENMRGGSSLVDLNFEQLQSSRSASSEGQQTSTSASLLDDEMLSLGLKSPPAPSVSQSDSVATSAAPDSLLSDLDEIFASSASSQQMFTFPANTSNTFATHQPGSGMAGLVSATSTPYSHPVPSILPYHQPVSSAVPFSQPGAGFQQNFVQNTPVAMLGAKTVETSTPTSPGSVFEKKPVDEKSMGDLDALGQTLMQQNLSQNTAKYAFNPSTKPVKVSMNQMASKSSSVNPAVNTTTPQISSPGTPTALLEPMPADALTAHPPPVSMVSGSADTTVKSTSPLPVTETKPASPGPQKTVEVKPLTDIFVPLETIQPSTTPPVNAYDKNGLKVMITVAKDRPRDDVLVMVISVLSTNTSPVKAFVFQAAVPKIMKVKLQPPSATDLPAFNPILPPSAITQVMLLANPQKEKIRLKFKISYSINEQTYSDLGDIDSFTVK